MELKRLPLPAEPVMLKTATRTLLEQAPEVGLATLANGEWIAAPLWIEWQRALSARGMDWPEIGHIVAEYRNELRLWVMGERPWDQCITGLAGRVLRRSGPSKTRQLRTTGDRATDWGVMLERVGINQAADVRTLGDVIERLGLDYTISPPDETAAGREKTGASAIVWAGGKRRDPEVPYGEATSASSPAAALAEALARFLIKDPGYPVPPRRRNATSDGILVA